MSVHLWCILPGYTVFITELFSQGVRRVYLHQSAEINASIIHSLCSVTLIFISIPITGGHALFSVYEAS